MKLLSLFVVAVFLVPPTAAITLPILPGLDADLPVDPALPSASPPALSEPLPDPVGWEYQLSYDCPDNDPVAELTKPCPYHVASPQDFYGGASIAVDPRDPHRIAVAVLSGLPANGTNGAGRTLQPVSLLTSTDQGVTFTRTLVPSPSADLIGQQVELVADPQGRLTLAVLYAKGPGPEYQYSIAVWALGEFPGTTGVTAKPTLLPTWTPEAEIGRISLVHVAQLQMNVLAWEELGTAAHPQFNETTGSWIRIAWSNAANDAATWNLLPETSIVGPCGDLSNIVTWDGVVYLACVAQTGYLEDLVDDWGDPLVYPGLIVMHAFTPQNATLRVTMPAPFGGLPTLSVDSRGRIAVASLELLKADRVRAFFTSGFEGRMWSGPVEFGRLLHHPDFPAMKSARLLGLNYQPRSDTFHFVYVETPLNPPEGPTDKLEPRVHKYLGALSHRGKLIFRGSLEVDHVETRLERNPHPDSIEAQLPQDYFDGLFTFGTREFLAFSDAGVLKFTELSESPTQTGRPGTGKKSTAKTGITVGPSPEFTALFAGITIALATLVVARVLMGRIQLKVPENMHIDTKKAGVGGAATQPTNPALDSSNTSPTQTKKGE